MPDEHPRNGKKWIVPLVSAILSFIVGVVFAAYIIGQRTGKVLELEEWKADTAPRIERMDGQGTLSFKLFHEEYLRTQVRQDSKLIELEKEIHDKQLEDLKTRIQALEKKQ